MALIKCSECGKDVSDKATSCPACGHPTGALNQSPTLIEATGKKWKKIKLISWIALIIGVLIFLNNVGDGGWQNPMTGLGFSLGFLGFAGVIVGKFGAWWHHD